MASGYLINILNDGIVYHVYHHMDDIDETIYRDDIPRFSRGFIIKVTSTTNSTGTMFIRIEIPWAYEQDIIPIYLVHQIGFIPPTGGPCLKFILPKTLARNNGKFYEVECESTNCLDESISLITPCSGDGSTDFCRVLLSHCEQLTSFTLDTGIRLTTNHDVFGVYMHGNHAKFNS